MDTTASDITFDADGVCNFCRECESRRTSGTGGDDTLKPLIERIKREGAKKQYDCIVGVSGGLDSSYALYAAKQMGLRPLAVHVDNGWNSELAVNNIERLVTKLSVDLYTCVIDWDEVRGLQRAFFKAHVVDIELLTDNAIWAALYREAGKRKIKYILAGTNNSSEGMRMPASWVHFKFDKANIKAIYRICGNNNGRRLKSFPMIGWMDQFLYRWYNGIRWVSLLDYVKYEKDAATGVLTRELGWRPYEKKHYESVFTRFYQGHILPVKFNVDKRRNHYSALICSGQMTRERALQFMQSLPYDNDASRREDETYVLKKLGFSAEEFQEYISAPAVPHEHYPSSKRMFIFFTRCLGSMKRLGKR